MLVLVRLPKLIQLAEAQNTSELEAAKTVVVKVCKSDCSSRLDYFFFPPPGEDRDYLGEPKENVLLCQALQTFFPNSGLQTCIISFKGRQIPKNCCNIDHNINVMDKLTLMVEERDFTEARHLTKRKVRGTTTGSKSFKKSRSLQLHQKLLQDQDNSYQERNLTLSSTETDEDALKKIGDTNESPHSPTF